MSKMVKRRFEEMDLTIRNTQAMVIDHEARIVEISESVQRQTQKSMTIMMRRMKKIMRMRKMMKRKKRTVRVNLMRAAK